MFKNRFTYMNQESGGEGQGSGGGDDIAAKIQAEVDKQVAGLKAKNAELLGKLKDASETVKQFEGIDPNQVRTLLSRINESEEARLIADGKVDEVLNKRTERLRNDFQTKFQSLEQKAQEAESKAQKYTNLVMENALRQEAAKAGLLPQAIDDALYRGRAIFELTDDLGLAAKEGLLGKDGVSQLSVSEWFEDARGFAPHWFPAQASGSGTGKPGIASQVKNRSQMTPAEKAAYISKHGQEAFFKLPG